MDILFFTGIDTGIGKTFAVGLFYRYLLQHGFDTITAKLVQTGCGEISEDIAMHRQLAGVELLPEDISGVTCPYLFKYPASPHLAAGMESRTIDPDKIVAAVNSLAAKFNPVLVEGAGGFLTPLTSQLLTADLAAQQKWKTIIVSSGRLGSINHTLLTLEAAKQRGIDIIGIIYNQQPETDRIITSDSRNFFKQYLRHNGYQNCLVELPTITNLNQPPEIDFSAILNSL